MTNNLELYPWFQFSSSLLAWLPIFFLYFSQFVSLSEAIQLGAAYYFSVCLFEVPSGYLSDRYGRRNTMLLAGGAFVAAYLSFLFAAQFSGLLLGQCLLAMAVAVLSGTDTAFLYDSLLSLDQQDDYALHEAKGQKYGFSALALASLAGGALGLVDLRLAYVLALLGAIWALFIVYQFKEPQLESADTTRNKSFISALRQCGWHLRTPILAWLFGVMTLMYCLEHIAYEFYQPYIKLLDISWFTQDSSAFVSGVIIAISMFGGTFGAAYSNQLASVFGVRVLLIIAMLMQLCIISGLAFTLSGLLIWMVVFRNFPMATIRAPVNATIAPHIGSDIRATYLSIQSLSARLVFSGTLYYLSRSIADEQGLDWPHLSTILLEVLGLGMVGLALSLGVLIIFRIQT